MIIIQPDIFTVINMYVYIYIILYIIHNIYIHDRNVDASALKDEGSWILF